MLIILFSVLSSHQALNRTPKYKQLLVKLSMALLCPNIFKKLMHTAPKILHLPFQRQHTWRVEYLRLIYCPSMLQFYELQAECAFTETSSSLEQMDWNLRQCRCWNDVFGEPPIPEVLYRSHPELKCSAASLNTPS